jgi:hypothetical protein
MKKDQVFPSRFLKAGDLAGRPIPVTIEHAMFEKLKTLDGKEQEKIVLYFAGTKKALPLNVTNWDSVAAVCGDDSDSWPGKKIELYPDKTHMGGKLVDCIRVRTPAQRGLPAKKPERAPASEQDEVEFVSENPAEGFDDPLPF